ncbi:ribosomal biogenesis factor-like [Dromiciops gliroides]|uniref:ribosomal biogenesis factor-like n=1 Tax=Dromiciops gliroides TaxID=33562 RepID=UPI001CC3FB09|nr:ribosomal biogenesis factor-like [Dromiciops gliroides]
MRKNKGKGQKTKNVFHIASKNLKVKNKANSVTTNLKKINIMNEEKCRTANKTLIDIEKELAHFSKMLSLEPLTDHLISQCSECETITVEDATRLMAQL